MVSRRIEQAFAVLSFGFVYMRVSAACLPNFFKSRSNVSLSFFERTSAIFSIAVACSPNPRVIT